MNLSSTINILVVDYLPENLELLGNILLDQGYEVRLAINLDLALETIKNYPPDLIVLNKLIAKIDSSKFSSFIELYLTPEQTPVIFIMNGNIDFALNKIGKLDFLDYIRTPFDSVEINARIENLFKIKLLQEKLSKEKLARKNLKKTFKNLLDSEKSLNKVFELIRNTFDLQFIFRIVVEEMGKFLKANSIAIVKYYPREKTWTILVEYSSDNTFTPRTGREILDEDNWIFRLIKQNKLVGINKPELIINKPELIQDLVNPKFRSEYDGVWLIVPISVNGQIWGMVSIFRSEKLFWLAKEKELALSLGKQLGISIYQSQLHHKLQQTNYELENLAHLDELTKVGNRRYFNKYMEEQWQLSRVEQSSLSLILADVDYFKKYNDYYGHLAGDKCLSQIAYQLKQVVRRKTDLVARYGGEEFAIVLPKTKLKQAITIGESIIANIHQLKIPHLKSETRDRVTLSLGIGAIIPEANDSIENFIGRVDGALYRAKRQGRDRLSWIDETKIHNS